MEEQPRYVLLVEPNAHQGRAAELAARVQAQSRNSTKSMPRSAPAAGCCRRRCARCRPALGTACATNDTKARGNFEEYKHTAWLQDLTVVDRLTSGHGGARAHIHGGCHGKRPSAHLSLSQVYNVVRPTFSSLARPGSSAETSRGERLPPATTCWRWFAGIRIAALDGVPVRFVEGDLADPETLPAALAEADVVVHTAAHVGDWGPPEKYRAINVVALEHMLQRRRRIGRLQRWIQISSHGVYPARHHYGTDETVPPDPNNLDGYTQTKAEAELVVQRHIREHGLPAVILRPGFIYGPGERHALKRVVEKIQTGKMKFIGRGDRLLNNTSVDNLCDAILLAIEKPDINGETFNIRDERLVTREEFVHTIADYLGKPHPRHVPEWLVKTVVGPIEAIARLRGREDAPFLTRGQIKFMTQNLDYSIAKAKRVLGYRPRVDFRDGIFAALDDLTGKKTFAAIRPRPQRDDRHAHSQLHCARRSPAAEATVLARFGHAARKRERARAVRTGRRHGRLGRRRAAELRDGRNAGRLPGTAGRHADRRATCGRLQLLAGCHSALRAIPTGASIATIRAAVTATRCAAPWS